MELIKRMLLPLHLPLPLSLTLSLTKAGMELIKQMIQIDQRNYPG